jgi:rod shape determining protein RodA
VPTTRAIRTPAAISERLWRINWALLALIGVIASIGVASLYSVSGGSFEPWAERHALRVLIGLGFVILIAVLPLRLWLGLAYPFYALALLLLLLVPLVGVEQMGARRWLGVGEMSFQPSEMMKVALVVMLARYYQWLPQSHVSRAFWMLLPLLAIAAPVALTLKQPDLGTAVLFAVVGLALMFLAGVNVIYFLAGGALAGALTPILWLRLHDYQRRRVLTFLDPDRDPLGAGYHITQSKIAIGSGGVSGKGHIHGTQSQLDFLPEKHTDFIFTMFAEEMGFAGALALLALFGLLIFLLLSMALSCRSQFARLLGIGPALIISIYVVINVGMVTGVLPVVGVPLPLVSYGGTAMMAVFISIGLAMNAFVNRTETIRRDEMRALW